MKKMVSCTCDVEFEGSIVDLKEYIEDLIEKYGEDSHIEIRHDYDNTDYFLRYKREETDKEYQHRLNEEAKQAKRDLVAKEKKEEKERNEFERLKKKYGV